MSKGLVSTMFDILWFFAFLHLSTSSENQCTNEEFRVATYNILYQNCGGYYDWCQCANSSPANYAANNIRPDVMGTQENGCQVDFGNDMGSPYEVVPYTCQSCNHNAIYFNSNKIQYDGVAGFEDTVHRDDYSNRMYSWAKMRTNGGFVFWVFNVHNPHEHGNPSGFQGDIAEQMIDKWQELGGDEPAVFTGDFNPHKDNNRWETYATSHGLTKVGQSDGGVCGFCDQIYVSNGDFDIVSTQVHGSGGSDHNAYSAVLRPRCGGSDPNTPPVSPPDDDNSDVKVIEWIGADSCTPQSPCQDAQSDCDIDADCAGDLICWQRDQGETREGYDASNINPDADACVQAEAPVAPEDPVVPEDPVAQCTQSGGDRYGSDMGGCCDSLVECNEPRSTQDSVYCADWNPLHGTFCWSSITMCRESCDSTDVSPPEEVKMVEWLGKDGCSESEPCQDGQSDCDNDAQCAGDLICWQRDNGETRQGYDASQINADADVCVQKESVTPSNPTDPDAPDGDVASMSDEFSGSSVDATKWEVMHFDASWKNQEKQCYVPQNTKVENGILILTATARSGVDSTCGGQEYYSGSIEAKTYFLHGSMEVRARLPSGDGLWPAIWLLGNDQKTRWPACGEIDLMEVANKDPTGSKATLHYGPVGGGSINLHFGNTPKVALKSEFHTWKIIRTREVIVMLFDGEEFGRKTRSQIDATNYANSDTMFDAPMRLVLNVAVGGQFTGIGNQPPNMETWDKATLEVDYVRTSDDQTIPDVPCLETVVCDSDTCASCQSRIDWLMDNRGKNYIQAKDQVKNEFPNDCNCDDSQFGVSALEGEQSDTSSDPISNKNDSSDGISTRFIIVISFVAGVILLICVTLAWSQGHCVCCLPKDSVDWEFNKGPATSPELAL